MSKPGFYFYNGDWLKKTRLLTLQARGAWIDLLAMLDERQPRGRATLSIEQYARFFSVSTELAANVLLELETTGVANIKPSLAAVTFASRETACHTFVTVESRRMLKEEKAKKSHRIRQERYRVRRIGDAKVTEKYRPSSSSEPSSSSTSLNHKNKIPAQPDGFAEFWSLYPKKKSKGAAEKAWRKLRPDEELLKAILSGVKRARSSQSWLKQSGQFIPYPATWLNAKGWEDQESISYSTPPRPGPRLVVPEKKMTEEEIARSQEFLRDTINGLSSKIGVK